jgi:DNA repair exonuclease SbcCD ATPase subunit
MAIQAKVTSLDALESFRANLIVFLTTAHRCVDEVGDEVRRTRSWLQNEQRTHWEGELKRRRRVLEQVEQELFSAKLSGLRETTAAQQNAVIKSKRAVEEAEEKLRAVKHWNRNFESCSDPLVKQMESLRYYLDHDMPKALAFLVQAQKTLEAYTEIPAPQAAPPTVAPPPENPA